MNKNQPAIAMASAGYATVLQLATDLALHNKIAIWPQLGGGEKFWAIFAFAYTALLTASGWHYSATQRRFTGFIHAALMFGLAALVFVQMAADNSSNRGADDASAGIVSTANFIFIIVGILSAACGTGVIFRLFGRIS